MKRQRLSSTLDELVADGTLAPAQRAAVEERLAASLFPKVDSGARFVAVVAMLGGVLFAAGIISWIAFNWDALGKTAKLGGTFALLVAIHLAGFRLADRYPRTGVALTAAGVLSFGAALGVVAQVYHIHRSPSAGWLAWWLLGAPFVYVTRSARILDVVLALFVAWAFIAGYELLDRLDVTRETTVVTAFALQAAGLGALFRALEHLAVARGLERYSGSFRRFAAPAFLAGVYALSFAFSSSREVSLWALVPGGALAAGALVAAAAAGAGARRREAFADSAAMALGWAAIAATVCLLRDATFVAANIVLFTAIVALVRRGARVGRTADVNVAIAAFLITVMSRYFEYLHDRMEATVLFLGSGVVLLGLGFYLERRRRGWVRAAQAKAP